jgi:peptidoglycan L-alanyl-D-glutamate endopeptidase CwlK
MVYHLSPRSLEKLQGVHPDLQRVIRRALHLTPHDFTELEGLRSLNRQRQLVASGASTTLKSRHLTGHAVDIAPIVDNAVSWHWPHYYDIEVAFKQAARELGVDVEWGGDWTSFKDGPHWQLSWESCPEEAYDAALRGEGPVARIEPDTQAAEPESAREDDRERTGVAAGGATVAGAGAAGAAGMDLAENEGGQLAAGDAAQQAESETALGKAQDLLQRFIDSENTLEMIAFGLVVIVVAIGLYLLIRRFVRWRRALRRKRKSK